MNRTLSVFAHAHWLLLAAPLLTLPSSAMGANRRACALAGGLARSRTRQPLIVSVVRSFRLRAASIALVALCASSAAAQIITWLPPTMVIPGTEAITPGPGVDLSGWNMPGHALELAGLGGINLTNATFENSDLTTADFQYSNLTNANFANADLRSAQFSGAILTGATSQERL